jgi:transposase-like protein
MACDVLPTDHNHGAEAARRLLVRLLKNQGLKPKRIITDKLLIWRGKAGSYAKRRTPVA